MNDWFEIRRYYSLSLTVTIWYRIETNRLIQSTQRNGAKSVSFPRFFTPIVILVEWVVFDEECTTVNSKGEGMRRRNWRQTGSELCDVEMKCMACWTIIGDAFVWFCSLSRNHHNSCEYSVIVLYFPIPTICLIHSPNSIPHYPSFLPCSFSFTFIPFLTSPHSQPTHKPLNPWLGVSCLKSASQVRNNSILFFLFHDSHSSNSFTMQEQREEMEIERDVRTSSLPPKTRITDQPP